VYEYYINMLSKRVQERFYRERGNNPFDFKYISYLKSKTKLENEEKNDQGLVVMCTPGMLQSGQSRTLFDAWCHDPSNGLILTGYCVEGSLASGLKKGDRVKKLNGE
jgi:cleavage and polyadenylation specificity factor subunit 3